MSGQVLHREKVVAFTGAGVSAESGLPTFRDQGGLWCNYAVEDVATPQAWLRNPRMVLQFYNERRAQAAAVQPNAAHEAIASLQEKYDVAVVTQNVDDLHERAGSQQVLHVHGELNKARSSKQQSLIYDIGASPIEIGDTCDQGSQLRPHVVWFGEAVLCFEEAIDLFLEADKVLVVGTSLSVYPVAGLLSHARPKVEKIIVSLEVEGKPYGYKILKGAATELVPPICKRWLKDQAN